jgi:DNA replication factor GINS
MAHAPIEAQIKTIQDIYRVGYMNEEVRVSFKKDVQMAVGEVSVDAKEGDLLSIPRWLAKLLSGEGAVEIQPGDVANYVSRALNRERIARPHDISGIDVDFYVRANDYLEGLKEREKENLAVSLHTFVASRLEKIVKLAAASPLIPEMEAKLAAEERELYQQVHSASTAFKNGVLTKLG